MGAEIIIGVDVQNPLMKADELTSMSNYAVTSEMVVTDRRENPSEMISRNKVFASNQIFYDKVGNYWSEDFWGNYNIIEPTESLEHAVDKLKKQSN